jgi:hypothetical protein
MLNSVGVQPYRLLGLLYEERIGIVTISPSRMGFDRSRFADGIAKNSFPLIGYGFFLV